MRPIHHARRPIRHHRLARLHPRRQHRPVFILIGNGNVSDRTTDVKLSGIRVDIYGSVSDTTKPSIVGEEASLERSIPNPTILGLAQPASQDSKSQSMAYLPSRQGRRRHLARARSLPVNIRTSCRKHQSYDVRALPFTPLGCGLGCSPRFDSDMRVLG